MHTTVDDPQAAAAKPEVGHSLSSDLDAVLKHADGKTVTIGQIMDVLADRGHGVLIFLLSAPFLINPIPGLSTAFGFAIGILGLCVTFSLRPWLPNFIKRRTLTHDKLTKLIHGVERVLKKVERFAKPRLELFAHKKMRWLCGLSLMSLAFLLALPIPIPFNNVPPAIPLVILSFGMLERDGLLILIGHIGNIVLWIIMFFLGNLIWAAMAPIFAKLGWGSASPATQQAMIDGIQMIRNLV
ncbi:MAG: exopolysaccharide biosynthesis protein [Anaerolineae bacterium]|nr:exopolysaccharide biosynthesis protein [Phycisphaerae bacterium]